MEIIRKGSDEVFAAKPRGCCFPVGDENFRY
jgi:hypothetical protein